MYEKLDKGAHSVYLLRYHLVLVTKYRKKVFVRPDIVDELKFEILRISAMFDIKIIVQETDQDHIHILFKCSPKILLTKYICILKSNTSRILRKKYPEINFLIWKKCLWSPSYCLLTVGENTMEYVKKYILNQGKGKEIKKTVDKVSELWKGSIKPLTIKEYYEKSKK